MVCTDGHVQKQALSTSSKTEQATTPHTPTIKSGSLKRARSDDTGAGLDDKIEDETSCKKTKVEEAKSSLAWVEGGDWEWIDGKYVFVTK